MSNDIFEQGGPLDIKRTGSDTYEMRIDIPTDEEGMVGRECPNEECTPGYFKVKPGTGITESHERAYCPYCRKDEEPSEFRTRAQKDYAIALVKKEAIEGVNRMVSHALGLGPSGRKKIGGGLFSIEMSLKQSRPRHVPRPVEEELRRDVTCPHCGLEHSVFGLATWCADCGWDIFLTHVARELNVVEKMLSAVEARRAELGARVAGKDIENALEDLVSIFESVLKVVTRRHLAEQGMSQDEAAVTIEKNVRNRYQNVQSAISTFRTHLGFELFDGTSEEDVEFLRTTFQKRHPITHNLGVVDRIYLDRVRSGELQGSEIRVSAADVRKASEISYTVISRAYAQAFGEES